MGNARQSPMTDCRSGGEDDWLGIWQIYNLSLARARATEYVHFLSLHLCLLELLAQLTQMGTWGRTQMTSAMGGLEGGP